MVSHCVKFLYPTFIPQMETHHLYHLAKCWNLRPTSSSSASTSAGPPLTTGPVQHVITSVGSSPESQPDSGAGLNIAAVADAIADSKIYVSAAQMVFAARTSVNRDFITPENVKAIEEWGGKVCTSNLLFFKFVQLIVHLRACLRR